MGAALRQGGLTLALLAAFAVVPASAPAKARVNGNHAFLQVYDDNVENLETAGERPCPGDWKDLVYAMKAHDLTPDLFLVQQVSGPRQLAQLTGFMTRKLPGRYAGLPALLAPKPMRSPCGKPKALQTNAIVWRTGRLRAVAGSGVTWKAQAMRTGRCRNSKQARAVNIALAFDDLISHQRIVAASIHWPTQASGGPPCAVDNARQSAHKVAKVGPAALRIMAGDANIAPDALGGAWYRSLNVDAGGTLGYRDAAYFACAHRNLATCLANQWTVRGGHRRIDFLLAHRDLGGPPNINHHGVVTFDAADRAAVQATGRDDPGGDYSDHRSNRARIHY
jgi:hypothetical protein